MLWQDLVNVKKVYAAVTKLKEINPLYASIDLQSSASGLELEKKLSTCVVTDTAVDDNESNGHAADYDSDQLPDREPMVQRISDDEEIELYHHTSPVLPHTFLYIIPEGTILLLIHMSILQNYY